MSGLLKVTWHGLFRLECVEFPLDIHQLGWGESATYVLRPRGSKDDRDWGRWPGTPEFDRTAEARQYVDEHLVDLVPSAPREEIEPRFLLRFDLLKAADDLRVEIEKARSHGRSHADLLAAQANALAALAGMVS